MLPASIPLTSGFLLVDFSVLRHRHPAPPLQSAGSVLPSVLPVLLLPPSSVLPGKLLLCQQLPYCICCSQPAPSGATQLTPGGLHRGRRQKHIEHTSCISSHTREGSPSLAPCGLLGSPEVALFLLFLLLLQFTL